MTLAPGATDGGGAASAHDLITLPLATIIKGLPDSLKAFIASPPDAGATVAFPVSRIMPQLAKGSIKVPFGELVKAAPAGVFVASPNHSDTPVNLPLKEVLPQLGSAMKRKSAKLAPSVPAQNFFAPPKAEAAAPPTPATAAAPTFEPASPGEGTRPAAAAPATAPPGKAAFSLAKLLTEMPEACRQLAQSSDAGGLTVHLPVDRLAPQLPKGKVLVTLGEIVEALPPGTFGSLGEHADTPVKLPLSDVLAQIGPGAIQRKQAAKKLEGLDKQDFFGKPSPTPPAAAQPPPPSAPPTTTFTPAFRPTASAAPAPPTASAPSAAPPTAPSGQVAFFLSPLLEKLPEKLRSLVAKQPATDTAVHFPAERLAPQLAKGRISVTLKELAEAAPVGTFANVAGNESQPVPLPLSDVLAQIGPGAIKRREPVKKLEGLDQQDFFGGGPAQSSPPPEGTTFMPKPGPPSHGTGYTTFEPKPVPTPQGSGSTVFIPAESAPQVAPQRLEASSASSDAVPIPVTRLIDRWSAQLKADISRLPENTVIVFPAETLGQVLKTGRVHFTWPQLRNWARPPTSLSTPALESAGTLDIPLRAVVGPFMAAMRGKPSIPETPSAASRTAPQPTPPPNPTSPPSLSGISMTGSDKPPPAPAVFTPPLSASSDLPAEAATLGDLLGQPDKRGWTPVEIVQRVAGLPGVRGAMLSLFEGQIAAAELPGIPSPPAIARHVPQLFNSAAEAVRQMEMESLAFLSFTTAGTPWLVFNLGNIFFTVQGRPGEHPPVSRLESIAVQIGKHCR